MNRPHASYAVPIFAIFLVVLAARPARAKAFELRDEGWEGASEFLILARAELGADRVAPRGDLDWSRLDAADALLFIHPERAISSEKLATFMRAGGRIGILDDFGAAERTLARFGIQKAPAPIRPLAQLRNNPELAIAQPVPNELPGKGAAIHPAVEGVERLVTNHPTTLRSAELTPILRIPTMDGDAMIGFAGEPKTTSSTGASGKLIAMSDPSVLINEMLRYPGNRAFASALVRYLARQDEGGTGKLYILTNNFVEHGSYGAADLRSELETHLETLRHDTSELLGDGLAGRLGWGLGALLALGLAGATLFVIGNARAPALPRFTRGVPSVAQGGAAGRAAVLSAASTPAALVLLELKSALEEALAHRLGVVPPERPPLAAMLDELTRIQAVRAGKSGGGQVSRELDAPEKLALKELLQHMSRAEADLVNGRGNRVRDAVIKDAARLIAALLSLDPKAKTAPRFGEPFRAVVEDSRASHAEITSNRAPQGAIHRDGKGTGP